MILSDEQCDAEIDLSLALRRYIVQVASSSVALVAMHKQHMVRASGVCARLLAGVCDAVLTLGPHQRHVSVL